MIKRLVISNYALINHIEIDFNSGFSIITGETGAGKSIILGALSLILGDRVETKYIQNGEAKSIIEAVFDIEAYNIKDYFTQHEIDYFPNECIIRREIQPSGRSRAFINDTPVSLADLRELSIQLIDIHSQHSNLLISKPAYQLQIIDSIAGNEELLEEYQSEYQKYSHQLSEYNRLKSEIERQKEEEDYLTFQFNQIKSLNLSESEDEELVEQQKRLSNVTDIKENLWKATELLSGGMSQSSVLDDLKEIIKYVSNVQNHMSDLTQVADRLESCLIELRDISQTIEYNQENLETNPAELERIETRLNEIYSLEQKHHVQNVNALLQLQSEYENKLRQIEFSDEIIEEKEKQLKIQYSKITELSKKLSDKRKKTATEFEKSLVGLAQLLGLKNTQFSVDFDNCAIDKTGIDKIEFLFSFNKQQAMMPVGVTASGGEISRLMLCIKSLIAKAMKLPTIIFDEVDTGVSGEIANKIGEMMRDLSANLQVMAITHLPQVAAMGGTHYKVYKRDMDNATQTNIELLNEQDRVIEIARMLSGKNIKDAAIENAKSLIYNN